MSYVTNAVGPPSGPLLYRDLRGVCIGVIDPTRPLRPSGIAYPTGWDAGGRATFRLVVRGEELPGRWIVLDRRFVEAEG